MIRAALFASLLMGCVDITFRVPCSASLVRYDTLALDTTGIRQDTVAVFRADSLGCPREP